MSGSTNAVTLVVGAGGLLGSAVARAARARGDEVVALSVPWSDPTAARRALVDGVRDLWDRAGDRPWRWYWCAGTGVVSTPTDVVAAEADLVEAVLRDLEREQHPASPRGTTFFASSAGALYAGNDAPPYDESSPLLPLSAYGHVKLRIEAAFSAWAARAQARLLIGRISTLYGPAQDIAKPQGLISHLVDARLADRRSTLYVPLSTERDFLWADDAGAMIVDAVAALEASGQQEAVKIVASYEGVTLAEVVAAVEEAVGLPLLLDLVETDDTTVQSHPLRFATRVLTEVPRARTSLLEGIREVVEVRRATST